MIEFKNIYKSFKDKHVLEDVSFSIDKGEFVCIIGPSGCGKTTAFKNDQPLDQAYSWGLPMLTVKTSAKKTEIEFMTKYWLCNSQTGYFPI